MREEIAAYFHAAQVHDIAHFDFRGAKVFRFAHVAEWLTVAHAALVNVGAASGPDCNHGAGDGLALPLGVNLIAQHLRQWLD
jgi:uncharacterized protein YjlB